MDKSSNLFRIALIWVAIVPDLILSYYSLRNPFLYVEIVSLILNFIAATILFYIYIEMGQGIVPDSGQEAEKPAANPESIPKAGLYGLVFGSLIEDILVWSGLFFVLYNIVPVTLWIHRLISINI
jgi:amino acid transporter